MALKVTPILANYNKIINLVSRMDHLNSVVDAESGDNDDTAKSTEHLLATKSILSSALKDACEWVREHY